MELEQLLAVEREHRDALAVAALEPRVERHVDLDELERVFGAHTLHGRPRFVAQVAARLAEERDRCHRLPI